MADSKNKNYGSITKAADTKKQQGKMPPNANFSGTVDAMQDHVRQQVKETGKTVETSESVLSVLNVQKSLNDALRGMSQAVGQGAISHKQQQDLLKKIVSQNKVKGDGGLNPAKVAQMIAAITAKQAKQAKIPTLQKGGSVSKTGLAKIHAGESVFPKGSLEELVSLMKEQVYHIKQISGFYDDVKIPDMLKLDDKAFGEQFKDWITGGLKNAFPTFYKIGKAIGKPFYRLFKVRGGTYVYASHLSKAESPFRQISENIGILYTGSMLHMDRMINIQKATAEAVRDLATYTIPGKSYAAIEDIKPSKKWRAITAIAKGVGKGILGLGGAALGGMAGMAMGGPWGALAGAAGGGMLGYKKGGTMLKGMGKAYWRSAQNKPIITKEETKRFAQWKKEKVESLKFWKKKPAKEEDLLGATAKGKGKGIQVEISLSSIRNLSRATSVRPLGVQFAKVKSKFSKKNKDNVIDIALNPESQQALDQIKDASKKVADAKATEAKGGGVWGFISKIMPFLPLALGFIKGLPGMVMGWVTSALGSVGGWVASKGWGILGSLGKNVFKFVLGSALGKLLLAFAAGYGIGTLINEYLIKPFLEEKEKRERKEVGEKQKLLDADLQKNLKTARSGEDINQGYDAQRMVQLNAMRSKSVKEQDVIGQTGWMRDQNPHIVAQAQDDYVREHLGEYLMYHPEEIAKQRAEWLYTGDAKTIKAAVYSDPKKIGAEREESFLKYLQKNGTKMSDIEYKAEKEKYAESIRKKNATKMPDKATPPPSATPIDATENIIKIAKENAAKTLTDTYGLSAGEAKKYVEMAAKDLQNDAHSLTDSSILTKTAAAYMQKETGKPTGDKLPPGAPSDYGKTSAINEANQAAMTTDAVKQGVAEGMKPGLAEQAKAISSAVNLSASSGVSNQISNNSTTSTNANTNYNLPGQKDPWAQQAQLGNIPR